MRAKQFVPIVEAQQELFEVNMSPGNLKKLANGIDALVGIEFEMIVPDVGSVDKDDEGQGDESAEDIDDICRFFEGDWNDRSTINDLREELFYQFLEFQSEQIDNSWNYDGKGYFADWVRNNVSDDTVAEYLEKEEDEDPEEDIVLDNADWAKFIEENYEEGFGNEYYDNAYEEYREEKQDYGDFDEREFLRSIGIYNMSDVSHVVRTGISWPGSDNGDSEMNLENLADEFSNAIGRKVYYSTGYHGGPRSNDAYTIEPDSSLEGSDDDDAGLEFISPPLPVDEALEDVKKIKEWADDRGAYTNKTTGLHMNVSVPGFDPENLDYVKLALLLGDKYLLERFGRSANTYCKSAMDIIEDAPTVQDKEILFKKLKDNLETMASKVVVNYGTSDVKFGPVTQRIGKFTSINPKDNRVEFRGPGGDWLGQNFDKIEEALYRTVVALDAAVDPEKYRKEYLKKLTKMFTPSKGSLEDVFVQYAAGTITRQELKDKIKSTQAQRKQEKFKAEGLVEIDFSEAENGDWIVEYDNPNGDYRTIFLRRTEAVSDDDQALRAAIKLEPNSFKPEDIENIIVTEYSGQREYSVVDKATGEVINTYKAWTPLHAINIAKSYDSRLDNADLVAKPSEEVLYQQLRMAPGESEFVVVNNTLGQRVTLAATDSAQAQSRALRNNPSWDSYNHQLRVLSATPQAQEEPQYNMYTVIGSNSSEHVAATTPGEAQRIAMLLYPHIGNILSTARSGASQELAALRYQRHQEAIDRLNNTSSRNRAETGQAGEGEVYNVYDAGAMPGAGVRIRATSPEQAIERVRQNYNIGPERELEVRLENG